MIDIKLIQVYKLLTPSQGNNNSLPIKKYFLIKNYLFIQNY